MRIIKIKDTLGYAVVATAKVVADKNGVAVSETDANAFGKSSLKFKVKGASRQITKRDGSTMWKTQRMWCSTDKDGPFADMVKKLGIGDVVFLVGTIASSEYVNENGNKRRTTFCSIEYIQPIGQPSGGQVEAESDNDDDDDFDF